MTDGSEQNKDISDGQHGRNLPDTNILEEEAKARRDFMTKCGKYAIVVPPAMALLLSAKPTDASVTFSPGVTN